MPSLKVGPGEALAVRFAPRGARLALAARAGHVSEWDAATATRLRSLEAGGKCGICVA
jgi:hypothetical protein